MLVSLDPPGHLLDARVKRLEKTLETATDFSPSALLCNPFSKRTIKCLKIQSFFDLVLVVVVLVLLFLVVALTMAMEIVLLKVTFCLLFSLALLRIICVQCFIGCKPIPHLLIL